MEIKNNNKEEYFLAKWLEGEIADQDLKLLVSTNDYLSFLELRNGINNYELLEQPLNTSLTKIKNRIAFKKKNTTNKTSYRWTLSIAATLAILFGLFFLMAPNEINHTTAFGEQKTIELPDGSLATMNSKSGINFNPNSWVTNRVLNLTGEAYFKVKKGSQFTVNTTNGNISVLGTEFNVKTTDNFFEVVCFEGKVKVNNDHKEFILTSGKSVRKINKNLEEEYFTTNNFPAWTTGESKFMSVPLEFVIQSLEKQYNLVIQSNEVDLTRIYTGSFTHQDLDIALASVFKTMNIKYLKKENGIISLE